MLPGRGRARAAARAGDRADPIPNPNPDPSPSPNPDPSPNPSPIQGLIVSAGLYGLYVVPLSSVLGGTTGGDGAALLLLYEALGGLL